MSTVSSIPLSSVFESGDRMSREEFHRLYEGTPDDFKAELIGGIVYVASPLRREHGTRHVDLATVFGLYRASTPGVDAGDNATIILGDDAEPQPDLYMRIRSEFGGQSQITPKGYIEGAPELVAEIAHSSRSIDLHGKYEDYRQNGVREYVVVCLEERRCCWFELNGDRELPVDSDGVIRIHTFPGLWIDGKALLSGDHAKLIATAQAGLATEEHAAFARELESHRRV